MSQETAQAWAQPWVLYTQSVNIIHGRKKEKRSIHKVTLDFSLTTLQMFDLVNIRKLIEQD